MPVRSFRRFVALGDSTTEGLDDPYPDGRGPRGWADRLAARLDELDPGLQYANLAVRGRKVPQIRAEQLAPALAMAPDLASVVGGVNDILRPSVDLDAVAADVEAMVAALRGAGATVLMMTFPDPSTTIPIARFVGGRVDAYNDAVRAIAARQGATLADLGARASDPRLWSPDRLHANGLGHQRIADGMAEALGLPGSGPEWAEPVGDPDDAPALPLRVVGEALWTGKHLVPWVGRRLTGRSSGDGRSAKRPELAPVGAA